jgi:hypothetical protein
VVIQRRGADGVVAGDDPVAAIGLRPRNWAAALQISRDVAPALGVFRGMMIEFDDGAIVDGWLLARDRRTDVATWATSPYDSYARENLTCLSSIFRPHSTHAWQPRLRSST